MILFLLDHAHSHPAPISFLLDLIALYAHLEFAPKVGTHVVA